MGVVLDGDRAIQQALGVLGWTQKRLAVDLGVTEETISRWATGTLSVPKYVWSYLSAAHALKTCAEQAAAALGREDACPACGRHTKAMTPAERQRAYRERKRNA